MFKYFFFFNSTNRKRGSNFIELRICMFPKFEAFKYQKLVSRYLKFVTLPNGITLKYLQFDFVKVGENGFMRL